jgi:hypothetical protein
MLISIWMSALKVGNSVTDISSMEQEKSTVLATQLLFWGLGSIQKRWLCFTREKQSHTITMALTSELSETDQTQIPLGGKMQFCSFLNATEDAASFDPAELLCRYLVKQIEKRMFSPFLNLHNFLLFVKTVRILIESDLPERSLIALEALMLTPSLHSEPRMNQ